jgi:hypothetical protein
MAISNLPSYLDGIIQQGFLEQRFYEGLESKIAYRSISDKELFPNQIGESITKTRIGLMAPVTTYSNPSQNTGLDNGMTPVYSTMEQYTLAINQLDSTTDLNIIGDKVQISRLFLQNANTLGIQAAQSLDRIARNTMFGSYLSGNTMVDTTLGAPGTTVAIDDITGFTQVLVNGVMTPISASATQTVYINGTAYTQTGVSIDATNTSSKAQFGGQSGTITTSTNVSVANGTLGKPVVSYYAPTIVRPNDRAVTRDLTATDILTMNDLQDAVTQLRNNAVPYIDGFYHIYLSPVSLKQLFNDEQFQLLYRGMYDADAYKRFRVIELLDMRFIVTTEAPQQTITNASSATINVQRPIVCGAGSLIEGDFAGMRDMLQDEDAIINMISDVAMVTRKPIDRLHQLVSQSWYWIGGFCVPTDYTADQTIIPTANNSYYKRAVVLETA